MDLKQGSLRVGSSDSSYLKNALGQSNEGKYSISGSGVIACCPTTASAGNWPNTEPFGWCPNLRVAWWKQSIHAGSPRGSVLISAPTSRTGR